MTTANEGSEHGQPLGLALTDQLGPLPDDALALDDAYPGMALADQVRAYAARQVAAERERCAGICDALAITVELKYERILRIAASRILGA